MHAGLRNPYQVRLTAAYDCHTRTSGSAAIRSAARLARMRTRSCTITLMWMQSQLCRGGSNSSPAHGQSGFTGTRLEMQRSVSATQVCGSSLLTSRPGRATMECWFLRTESVQGVAIGERVAGARGHEWPASRAVLHVGCRNVRLGRSPDVDIRLASQNVSREHLRVRPQGFHLLVHDLRSANGTYVNGTRLSGAGLVEPGSTLRLGDVELQYVVLGTSNSPDSAPAARSFDFGGVAGPVNTGDPVNYSGNQVVGNGSIHQGNVHHGDNYELDFDNGFQELFSGRGPGRVIMESA